ncbi:hypothetical protein P170DRAFT_345896 [Aspergillus steynii IBT 23096]|uniref:3-hydroxyisobutyrate dehydrogenase n=1 Tax=Aspergillus steynii IBT 23096 TaxID=1392250 RepID=A0A2I2GRU9_9EURO|nr:uncharacterized protein P170DRAFT_345896 [Aspergillus steynii IBT 23096]PLB55598.1 hypothetical protein P170DRAFT_345896 [Aspergillus steynii IBT 23096]
MELSEFDRVGFIGLGAMGKHMVEHLATKLPSTSHIYIYDVVRDPMNDLVSRYPGKIHASSSPKHVAENSKCILSMVPEGRHVQSVYLDSPTGIICTPDLSSRILIDCSTIDTATSIHVKSTLTATHPDVKFYDAPVSGGTLGAQNGTVAFFVGCAPTDPVLPILTTLLTLMGKQVIPCGTHSAGLASKLCNNYLSGIIAIASAEALSMGINAGLDPRVLSSVFAAGTAQNAVCDRYNPCPGVVRDAPSSKGYEGGFKVQLMRKDFALAVEMAQRTGSRLVLGEQGLRTYEGAARDERCKDRDSRVVFRYLGGDERWARRYKL